MLTKALMLLKSQKDLISMALHVEEKTSNSKPRNSKVKSINKKIKTTYLRHQNLKVQLKKNLSLLERDLGCLQRFYRTIFWA